MLVRHVAAHLLRIAFAAWHHYLYRRESRTGHNAFDISMSETQRIGSEATMSSMEAENLDLKRQLSNAHARAEIAEVLAFCHTHSCFHKYHFYIATIIDFIGMTSLKPSRICIFSQLQKTVGHLKSGISYTV